MLPQDTIDGLIQNAIKYIQQQWPSTATNLGFGTSASQSNHPRHSTETKRSPEAQKLAEERL